MFGLFQSVEKQMRSNARNWLELSDKIYHYRRDELTDTDLSDLQKKAGALRMHLQERAEGGRLKFDIEALEPVLRRVGGKFYPRSGWQEWIEFLVVAAIVILACRQYFFQPFKIPTNSMWPTYNGMVPEVHATPADEPAAASRLIRKAAFGASAYRIDAPADGEVLIPIQSNGVPLWRPTKGRHWLVLPQAQKAYDLVVGDQIVTVSVPEDFDFGWMLKDTFAPGQTDYSAALRNWLNDRKYSDRMVTTADGRTVPLRFIHTGKTVKKGERVLSFDIVTGDQLFVDRMSYHFVRPKVGSGFVFRTDNIEGLMAGGSKPSYYIKRLAGEPGDTLEIRPPVLYRNGGPITGAQAFDDNAARHGRYRGYINTGLLGQGSPYTVSENGYIALGDNSNNSLDSRMWGEVPKKDVVGRPLWVFYPFTSHWGSAK
ncbi:signal peptidase I [Termitidicoccus mucosus]|uniref:Signal peptidase I n=1 Tax=Termitidicoccus mucosus TaxID=1184151 RepID=A0A178IME7_9BACT|nr:signal peptidase [Opitutaceae bacterium TSB47]